MASGDDLCGHLLLDGGGKLQQAQGVGDLRSRAGDSLGELFLSRTEIRHELLICARLLQRVELGPVEVFQEGVSEQVSVVGLPDDRRNRGFARELGGAQAALAHDQLVARVGLLLEELLELLGTPRRGDAANDDGLENADLLDGCRQFLQVILIETSRGCFELGTI